MRKYSLTTLLLLSACIRHADADTNASEHRIARTPVAAGAVSADDPGEILARKAAEKLVGTKAPDFTVKTVDGKSIRLGDLYGKKAVYLKFWATWCVPCRQQMPHFEHVARTAGDDLAVIAINTGINDTPELVKDYRRRLGLTMPITIDSDGRLARAFDLRVTPQHVVIAKDGRIAFIGHLADDRLHKALENARRGDPAPVRSQTAGPVSGEADALRADALTGIDGRKIALVPPPGKTRLLLFFSPWCESYWKKTRPEASQACRAARKTASADRQGRWVAIASRLWTSEADLRAFANENKIATPLLLDSSGELFRHFGVRSFPTIVVLNSSGKIGRTVSGSDPAFVRELKTLESRS